jgi:hypothetical protein
MSLLARLLALVLIAVLPAVGLVAWSHLERRREAEAGLRASALHYAQDGVAEIRDVVEDARQTLRLLARVAGPRVLDGAECDRMTEALQATNPQFVEIAYADRSGNLVCSAGSRDGPRSLAGRPFFTRLAAERGFTVGG